MVTCWNSSLQSSFQLCFISFVRYIWIHVFCLNDLLFHDLSQGFVQKITPTCLFNASEWHSLSHSFILSIYPYAIWHNGRLQKWTTGETFHLLYTKMKKLRFSWLILEPKISLAFTFICKAFSHKIWSILILTPPCGVSNKNCHKKSWCISASKKTLFFKGKFFETVIYKNSETSSPPPNFSVVSRWNINYIWMYRVKRKGQVLTGIYHGLQYSRPCIYTKTKQLIVSRN